jgi:hypothetical protein
MNYTKILRKGKFKFESKDDNIKISSQVLKDVKKTKLLIENYIRIGIYKIIL